MGGHELFRENVLARQLASSCTVTLLFGNISSKPNIPITVYSFEVIGSERIEFRCILPLHTYVAVCTLHMHGYGQSGVKNPSCMYGLMTLIHRCQLFQTGFGDTQAKSQPHSLTTPIYVSSLQNSYFGGS